MLFEKLGKLGEGTYGVVCMDRDSAPVGVLIVIFQIKLVRKQQPKLWHSKRCEWNARRMVFRSPP